MYRYVTLLVLLIALVAAGCGGSDEDGSPPGAAAVADAGADESADRQNADGEDKQGEGGDKQESQAEQAEGDEQDEQEAGEAADSHEDGQEAFSELSPKQLKAAIETVVRTALLQYGLKVAAVEVTNKGRNVAASVTRATACRAVASQEPNMVISIQHGAPTVKSVRFTVAGTGQQLGYYVLRCKKPQMPNGPGRVEFEHTGVGGPYTSKPFEIQGKHWALEWVNQGASLAVIVLPLDKRAEENPTKPVGSRKPESGRYEYRGPGKYEIKAYGQGRWSFRVKEIG